MQGWSVEGVVSFLKSVDLAGPAANFYTHGVSGADFAAITEGILTQDFRMSAFAASKVLLARDKFLAQGT